MAKITVGGKLYVFSALVVSFLAAAAAAAALEVYLLVGRVIAGLCEKVTFRVSNGYLNLPIYLPMAQ